MGDKILYFQSDNKDDNYAYARCYVEPFKPIDKFKNIGDGIFDLIMKQQITYEGLVKFGTLCDETGEEYPLPVKPWTPTGNEHIYNGEKGDIPIYHGTKKYIGNTSKNLKNILQWHKFLNGDKRIYICDRNILVNFDVKDLYNMGLLNKIIKIDNKFYLCRLLTLTEYKNYILNDLQIQNMPIVDSNQSLFYYMKSINASEDTEEDLIKSINKDIDKSTINKTWNFIGVYTLCYSDNLIDKIGYYTADNNNLLDADNKQETGWRPVLEEIEYKFIKTKKNENEIYTTDVNIDFNKIKDIEYNKNIRIL